MTTMGSHFRNIETCDCCQDDFCTGCNSGGSCEDCGSFICESCSEDCGVCKDSFCKDHYEGHICDGFEGDDDSEDLVDGAR